VRRKTDAVLDRDLSELETDLGNVLARRQEAPSHHTRD
jgi:hypothetical protein